MKVHAYHALFFYFLLFYLHLVNFVMEMKV